MKINLEEIKKYWQKAGEEFPMEGIITPTSRDPYLGRLEEKNILNHLERHHFVLEIGCGDALHTIKYARKVKELSGIDIAESLINIAKKRAVREGIQNINFVVGSALDIKNIFCSQQFNCVISQRCLINFFEWQYQQEVILQVHSLLQEGGLFLLTEGFQEEIDNLNIVRGKLGLSKIKIAGYNKNLPRKDFESFVSKYFDIIKVCDYGVYLFFSRVFHPLIVLPNEPKHDSKLNEIAMKICHLLLGESNFKRYSYNLFYVLRKKLG